MGKEIVHQVFQSSACQAQKKDTKTLCETSSWHFHFSLFCMCVCLEQKNIFIAWSFTFDFITFCSRSWTLGLLGLSHAVEPCCTVER